MEEVGRGIKRAVIQYSPEANPNDLLKQLITQVEIQSFMEQIPSMNDIFINLVKGKNSDFAEA